MRLIEELRRKYPGLAKRAEREPLAAVRLFCIECSGGHPGEVAQCTTTECSLHPFRMGHGFRTMSPGAELGGFEALETSLEGKDGGMEP